VTPEKERGSDAATRKRERSSPGGKQLVLLGTKKGGGQCRGGGGVLTTKGEKGKRAFFASVRNIRGKKSLKQQGITIQRKGKREHAETPVKNRGGGKICIGGSRITITMGGEGGKPSYGKG